jgi:CheY-like chemotaxis protein
MPHAPLRVLVADDHPDSRLLIQTFLSLLGFVVQTAADGREAVALAEQFHPDVVFLDIWMPEMGGVEACQRLREGPCPRPIPIFGVTADLSQLDQATGGFDLLLPKPVDLDYLAALVRERQHKVEAPRFDRFN